MFKTVSEFAQHILQSGALAEKLRAPVKADGSSLDFDAMPALFMDNPVRDDVLQMRDGNERLPKFKELNDAYARAFCLERFAGHELQAIELFAWALLAFPNAPLPLRRGFLAALVEEQAHLQLYRERLFAHDSDLGQHALSNYFWKLLPAVANHAEPELAFLATVGLTLEQANLDFSLLYRDAFFTVGDEESAKTMHQVHLDEIGHVRLAALWLPKRAGGKMSLAAAYQKNIPFPLSAARAKARRFDVKARKKAGLDDEMIEFVRQARPYERNFEAKERKKDLRLRANFGGEENRGSVSQNVEQATSTLKIAFAHLFSGEARFLSEKTELETEQSSHDKVKIAADFSPPFLQPVYSWLAKAGQVAWWPNHKDDVGPSLELLQKLHDKAFAVAFDDASFTHQFLVHVLSPKESTPENIAKLIQKWPIWAQKKARLKPRFSSSGRGHLWVENLELSAKNQRRLQSTARKAGMILEPEFLLESELSSQWFVTEKGRIHFLGSTQQLISLRGAPTGNQGLILFEKERTEKNASFSEHVFDALFQQKSRALVQKARNEGFFGPCGIDGFAYRAFGDEPLQLRAISELNARFTTGWVALGVLQRALDVLRSELREEKECFFTPGSRLRWQFFYNNPTTAIEKAKKANRKTRFFAVGCGGLLLSAIEGTAWDG